MILVSAVGPTASHFTSLSLEMVWTHSVGHTVFMGAHRKRCHESQDRKVSPRASNVPHAGVHTRPQQLVQNRPTRATREVGSASDAKRGGDRLRGGVGPLLGCSGVLTEIGSLLGSLKDRKAGWPLTRAEGRLGCEEPSSLLGSSQRLGLPPKAEDDLDHAVLWGQVCISKKETSLPRGLGSCPLRGL